ncbi:MAG TPA: tyrosine-protein phosphatase [Pyrinomonadaceae bacterium]|nr:tyrosine-protein phosphatase [Pyrinomonadaceae bacterium]
MRIDYRLLVVAAAAFLTTGVAVGDPAKSQSSPSPQQKVAQVDQPAQLRGPEAKGPVPKFGVLWEGKLTRSGLPKNEDGWKWLRAQGVNSIVNFRARNDVDYKGYGFDNALWIPMDNGRLPTQAEAEAYLAWIQDPANQPVNIQCAEGKDRTGMMAALARYAIDGWTIDEALAEASLYRKGEPLANVRIRWLREWASKHQPGSHRRKSVADSRTTPE